jgi:cyanophycinase-like exopeptidase
MNFMLSKLYLCFFFLLTTATLMDAQSFSNWILGDTTDYITEEYRSGLVLAGGGGDNDQAMQWMLENAAGGDVLIIRASGSDGYNPYFFEELGIDVNSVETIRFNAASAANDAYVLRRIREAEVLFIAGGDQYDYYQYWKDTPVEDALNYLILDKQITVGGTSAGMAILGGAYYTPSGSSLQSDQALANPYHPNVEILGNGDFLLHPLMGNLVTDTHYDQRDRQGRHMTFLARIAGDHNSRSFGIACNEYTAVCIDEAGIGRVFGQFPDYDDYAYFLMSNCQEVFDPEILEAGEALSWNRGESAVKVYQAPGKINGSTSFDLNDWQTTNGGHWENWYVEDGTLLKNLETNGDCAEIVTSTHEITKTNWTVYPNPFQDEINLQGDNLKGLSVELLNLTGQSILSKTITQDHFNLSLQFLPDGVYNLILTNELESVTLKLLKTSLD